MSDDEHQPIVSDDEIERALAEAAREANIPNLDDSAAPGVVAVPVPITGDLEPIDTARHVSTPDLVAVVEQTDGSAAEAPAAAGPATSKPADGILFRAADRALWAINLPFTWLKPQARQLVGTLAIATIALSLLYMYLIPIVAPNRHLVTDLHRDADAARPAPSETHDAP